MYLGSQKEMVVGTTTIILTRASWTEKYHLDHVFHEINTRLDHYVPVHVALVKSTLCILYSSVACSIVFYLRYKDLPKLSDSSISVLLLSAMLAQGQVFKNPKQIFYVENHEFD